MVFIINNNNKHKYYINYLLMNKNILISSQFPLGCTGYGNQTYHLSEYLIRQGYSVSILCWDLTAPYREEPYTLNELEQIYPYLISKQQEKKEICKLIKYYSRIDRSKYFERIITAAKHLSAYKVIVFQDIWVFEPLKEYQQKPCPFILWFPVHNTKLSTNEIECLKQFDKINTISKFGQAVLNEYNIKAEYVPHIVSNNFYDNKNNKLELRKNINIDPNTIICLMVARNSEASDRKAFNEQIKAFSEFNKEYKNSKLLLHTHKYGANKNGINLIEIIHNNHIQDKVIFSDQNELTMNSFGEEYLRNLYTLSDVLLSASKTEGFGIPIIESQLCNTPVITNNCTAMPENTIMGISVKPEKYIDEIEYNNNKYYSESDPSVENITNAIKKIVNNKIEYEKIALSKFQNLSIFKDFIKI